MENLSGRSILIVEDDTLIQWGVEDALKSAGYDSIQLATSWREARAKIQRSRPELAILDVQLGHATSVPLADLLVEAGIPFVFLSAHSPSILPERHRTRPFVPKPFDRNALTQQVHKALAQHH